MTAPHVHHSSSPTAGTSLSEAGKAELVARARRNGPQLGDTVRVDWPYYAATPGKSIGIIDGCMPWLAAEGKVVLTLNASAYRDQDQTYVYLDGDRPTYDLTGLMSGHRPDHRGLVVSCSGGPCPVASIDDLTLVGAHLATFWRWKDRPRAGGGVAYQLEVPLWSWIAPQAA
jgi:hypothetical protein